MIHRFLHWLLIMVLVLCMVACSPTSAQPTGTTAPTIAPTITPDATQPLVLVLPGYSDQKSLIAANRHYSDVMKHKGWNVEFYTVQSSGAGGMESFLPYIARQLCSGAARADGFLCVQHLSGAEEEPLLQAKASGQLYDCVSAAPKAVPEYWNKYQEQIAIGKYGLVLAGQLTPVRTNDLVLVVRRDILPMAGQDISDYDDLRALISRLEQAHAEKGYVQAYPQQLLNLWTRQQGYLQLFPNAGIYARMDDPDAKLVMLEDIPDFNVFCQDLSALKVQDLLQDPPSSSPSSDGATKQSQSLDDDLGPAAALDSSYNLLYTHKALGALWPGYTAFPLETAGPYADDIGDAVGADSLSHISLVQELIIPAHSRRAADAMAFIQWIYDDRRNADAVMYGQEGVDYALQGERVAPLGGAEPQDSQSIPSWQSWPGPYLFQMTAQRRICADAPDNAEALLHTPSRKPLAAPWLACLYDTKTWRRLTTRSSIDDRELFTNQFWDDFQRYHGSGMDVDAYIQCLRLGATDSAMQIYHDTLAEAHAMATQTR